MNLDIAANATVTSVPSTPPAVYAERMAELAATYLTGQRIEVQPDAPSSRPHRMTIGVWDLSAAAVQGGGAA